MHVQVMAGPFCLRNGLDYSPLEEGLEHAASHPPQVLLLLGPFVDANNLSVASGEPVLPGRPEGEVCSLPEVYSQHVLPALRRGFARLKAASPASEILVVPSLDEALGFHPLPQPPLDVAVGPSLDASGAEQLRRLGARLVPNPAHLSVEGLRLTVTSADALTPVLRAGLVLRPEEKRIEQAQRLLLQQRSLFPVMPREPASVAEARARALDFPGQEVPDVLVFPSATGSASGQFVDGRLFVNPGSVCRPAALGSFAEMWLTPPPAGGGGASLVQRARVDIKTFSS
uniref:DNA polymerase alpha subunit B n=1 Tax=Zooxanthella nutricula TaxID=1333877 RepID=A0A7S2QNU9_9DINO